MTTEIILIIFTIAYYLFSVFLLATIIQDTSKRHTGLQILGIILMTLAIAPIIAPIILGIQIGDWFNND